MPRGLKTFFLIHAIVALFFGLGMYVVPFKWALFVKWMPIDPVFIRIYGAGLLALAVGSWFSSRSTRWEEVRIYILLSIAFTVLSTIGGIFALLFRQAPSFLWLPVAIWVIFAIIWIYYYFKPRE